MKNANTKITSLERNGKQWTFILCDDFWTEGEPVQYKTDRLGEGLFKVREVGRNEQVVGCTQFNLNGLKTVSGAHKRIRRLFEVS